jgi:hypothetical protein
VQPSCGNGGEQFERGDSFELGLAQAAAALIAGRWHRGGADHRAGRDTVCLPLPRENRAQLARRDTIGTLSELSIDIIALFSPWRCYGGAPRGAVPVARDGPRLASAVSRLASATGLPSAPFGAPPTPRSGVGTKRKENPAQKRATGMKKTALFDTVNSERRERHRQRRARGQSRRRQRTRSRPRARFAAPSLLRLCTPALENFPQPLRRHRQAGDGARYADRIIDGRGDRRTNCVDATFARAFQTERIER